MESNGVLAAAEELGITIVAYSPLAQGVLTGLFHPGPNGDGAPIAGVRRRLPQFRHAAMASAAPVVALLREIGAAHGCTPAQVALAWVTQRKPGAVVAIPGASSPTQAEHNSGSMAIVLTAREIERLDLVSAPGGPK